MKQASPGSIDIYALFGNPVGHSLSPVMHAAAYRVMGLAAQYVPFCVTDLPDAMRGMRALGIRGASITIPFKTDILPLLDRVDRDARDIGAVNTVANRNGTLEGINTDWRGLCLALQAHFVIAGKTIAILGAGGAARAAVYAVIKEGGHPIIVYRSAGRAEKLAAEFRCGAIPISGFDEVEADCLINATPIGMFPRCEESPLAGKTLGRFRWVMDTIYNPLNTRLLAEARKAGCATIPGLDMFVHQGAEQIKFWTGMEPPRDVMRQVVTEHLKGGDSR